MSVIRVLVRTVRPWFRSFFESNSHEKKLFVEQLEDRCFLTALPLNDGAVAAIDVGSDSLTEETEKEPPPADQDSDQPKDEENPKGDVENISPLQLPSWAKEQIVEASGEFVEAFQLGDNGGTVVHFRDASGDSKVLYRDAALVQEASLTDVIVNQLERVGLFDQVVREIEDLEVSLRAQLETERVRLEGLATLESPDGTTRLVGFTLQFESTLVGQRGFLNGRANLPSPSQSFFGGSAHSDETFGSNPRIETVGPQLPDPRDPFYPFSDFEDQLSVEFWLPQSRFLSDPNELETIQPQQLLPDPELFGSTWQEPTWQGTQDAPTVDDFFSEANDIQPHDEVIEELVPQNDLLKSLLDEPLEEDLLDDELKPGLDSTQPEQSFDASPEANHQVQGEEDVSLSSEREVDTPRRDWPQEQTWRDEADEENGAKRDQGSAHASDLNGFNVPRTGSTSQESTSTESDSAEARLPKSSGQTKQEP